MSHSTTPPADEPTGHYGAGYGEKNAPEGRAAPAVPAVPAVPAADAITSKPPVEPPDADAPESEKVALVFERS